MGFLMVFLTLCAAAMQLVSSEDTYYNASAPLAESEYQALLDLYEATNGMEWLETWNVSTGSDPCIDRWYGVVCSPPDFENFSHVIELGLAEIGLEGTIPASAANLTYLEDFDLAYNQYLSGTIPAGLFWLPKLCSFRLDTTSIHGPIPPPPTGWNVSENQLTSLIMSFSLLSGTLPTEMSLLTKLASLSIAENFISGDASVLPTNLQSVYIFFNRFYGPLGSLPFLLSGKLEIVDLSGNCFYGTIPDAICTNQRMSDFSLGMMNSASSCSHKWFKKSAFLPQRHLEGSIPDCLFKLPHLQYLTLSYNHLTGTIPSMANCSGISFDLEYNLLNGHVPRIDRSCYVNLYNNRLSGDLMHNYSVFHAGIGNNRLSGGLPAVILNGVGDYSDEALNDDSLAFSTFMTGNLFSCNWNGEDVPPGTENFQCGTNEFDKSYAAWWLCIAMVGVMFGGLYYSRTKIVEYIDVDNAIDTAIQWYQVARSNNSTIDFVEVRKIWDINCVVCICCMHITGLCVFVLAPTYAILTVYYGTYTYQAAWSVASVLLSGAAPFTVQLLLLLLVLAVCSYLIHSQDAAHRTPPKMSAEKLDDWTNKMSVILMCSSYVLVNFVVVGTVNVAFIATSEFAPSIKYQIAISTFKLGWSVLCLPYMSRFVAYELAVSRNDFFSLELFVSLMNNIGLPFLAVMSTSSKCFFDLYRGELNWPGTNTAYNYPYYYSYQCAYTYFNYYVVAFVYVCIFAIFGQPMIELTLYQVQRLTRQGSLFHMVVLRLLPRILKPLQCDPDLVPDRNSFRPYFDSTQFLVSQFTLMGLMLTMGVVFPPLAVCLLVTVLCTSLYTMLKVGRFVSSAVSAKQLKYVTIIEQESRSVVSAHMLHRAYWILLTCSCLFMTLFLFDTLGDAQGIHKAYWVLIVIPLLPVILFILVLVCRKLTRGVNNNQNIEGNVQFEGREGIELKDLEVFSPIA